MSAPGRERLEQKALSWLARREHSAKELREKLLRWAAQELGKPAKPALGGSAEALASGGRPDEQELAGTSAARIDALIASLEARRLLSDERFTESRVHLRQGRYGNRRIAAELRQHGLRLPEPVQEELAQSESDRARRVLAARFDKPAQSAAELVRRQRFLVARGFSTDAIRAALRTPED